MNPTTFRILILVFVLLFVASAAPAAPEKIETLAIGATAPDFNLPGVDGEMHALAEYKDAKVLVIVFTCNHCPTAQAYEERIKKLASDFKDQGVMLVAISPNDDQAVRLDELGYTDLGDSLEDMKVRAKDKQFNFPYLYDGQTQAVSKAYGPMSTPHVFVFDEQRKLRYVGRVDDNERDPAKVTSHDARNAIEAVLAGKPIPVETTRTVGCSIKWASKRDSVQKALDTWAQEPVAIERIDLAGVKGLLANETDKLRLINIWATYCGPCVIEFPELVTINHMYRGRDFEMVSINVEAPEWQAKVLEFLRDKQASFKNYLFDGNVYQFIETVDKDWPGPIPYTLLVAPGGRIIYRHLGAIEPLEVKKTIVEYLGRTYK